MKQPDLCDCCGEPIEDDGSIGIWDIGLRFRSSWDPAGHVVTLVLCGKCGSTAANLLGFCYDTGKILSLARKEMVDGCQLTQSMDDIIVYGIKDGMNTVDWHAENPKAPIAARMQPQPELY